jgi:hypothetical protein
VGSDPLPTAPRFERHPAALTPRPTRLLLIGRVRAGQEPAVREAQADFPFQAAAEAGIEAVEAFIGSGYYALAFESSTEDMQQTLSTCLNDARMKAFFSTLEPAVEGLPDSTWLLTPGDDFHAVKVAEPSAGEATSVLGTASLPLAANMYRWRMGEKPQLGEEPHGAGI